MGIHANGQTDRQADRDRKQERRETRVLDDVSPVVVHNEPGPPAFTLRSYCRRRMSLLRTAKASFSAGGRTEGDNNNSNRRRVRTWKLEPASVAARECSAVPWNSVVRSANSAFESLEVSRTSGWHLRAGQ